MKDLTKENFEKLYYEEGRTIKDISSEFELSATSVRNRMKAWGLKSLLPGDKKKELYEKIKKFNDLGYSDAQIAEELDLDLKYINSIRLKLKLPKNLHGKISRISELTPDELRRRVANMETQAHIAQIFNTTDVTISNYMRKWNITPLNSSDRRDLNNPSYIKIKSNPEDYREEVLSLTRYSFCEKYGILISQYNSLREILSIPKEKSGYSKWRGLSPVSLSEEQMNLVIASMLGDGSFRKLKYGTVYKEFHSFKQMTYLYKKAEILKPFIDKIIPEGNGFLLQTIPIKDLDYLYDLFYPNEETWKLVPDEIIDNFNIDWIGYWYLDDGSLDSRNPLISNKFISLNQFSKLESRLKDFGIDIIIKEDLTGFHVRVSSLSNFYKIVNKYVTPDVAYKVDEAHRIDYKSEDYSTTLGKQWEILYDLGFPYPEISKKWWQIRFNSLVNTNSKYKAREKSSSLCGLFYPQMYNHLIPIYQKKDLVIENRIKYADRVTPASLLTGLKLMSKETRTNFSPLMTKVIVDKISDDKPLNILDYSMGFGGRLLGVMASENKHNYYGIEPWLENINSAKKMMEYVDDVIPNSSERLFTYNQGSEIFIPELDGKIDMAISSPPYFNYEKYVDEDTQCYVKYSKYEDWLEKYWRATVINIKEYLREGGHLILNIKSIAKYDLENDMRRIIEEEGFRLVDTMQYNLSGRFSNFNDKKQEPIFIFKK